MSVEVYVKNTNEFIKVYHDIRRIDNQNNRERFALIGEDSTFVVSLDANKVELKVIC